MRIRLGSMTVHFHMDLEKKWTNLLQNEVKNLSKYPYFVRIHLKKRCPTLSQTAKCVERQFQCGDKNFFKMSLYRKETTCLIFYFRL